MRVPFDATDLLGRRVGLLTVMALAHKRTCRPTTCYLCRCDCGATCIRTRASLRAPKFSSCGCRRKPQHAYAKVVTAGRTR